MKKQLSFTGKHWKFRIEAEPNKSIDSLEKLQESILSDLGLENPAKIQQFINPSLNDLRDPFALKNMNKAVARTIQAIKNGERIMVAGDFDADGITSTVILVSALQACGAKVSYFIPDRTNDSHGLQKKFMENFAEKNVKLVITCDCATNDAEEISYGKELGIDTIVTDHHQMDPARFPKEAVAVVNCQTSDNLDERNLSGSAVAFKFATALVSTFFVQEQKKISEIIEPLLEIATIGIISDCVKLVGDNRIIAKYGLAKMSRTSWNGLKILLERLKINKVDEQAIGFFIAPHLNAASRLGDVMIAVQLFLGNPAKNEERVAYLMDLNRERRVQTDLMIKSAEKQIQTGAACQFFFAENWEQGILGLAASHFVEKLNVPIVMGTIRQIDGMLSASCRAPEGYSMIDGLENSAKFLESFGGHAGAAGFIAKPENLEKIRGNLNKFFAQEVSKEPFIEGESFLNPEILNLDLVEFLNFLSPFGAGNPAKIFGLQKVKITDIYTMGKDGNHARFTGFVPSVGTGRDLSSSKNKQEIQFVAFFAENFLEKIKIGDEIDILVSVSENEWQGKTSVQLKLIDARKS